jgi:competence protein ComEC
MAPKLTTKQWVLSHIFLTLLLTLTLLQWSGITNASLSVSFLDVGQGDAILIQTPEHKNILIDTGPDGAIVQQLGKELSFFNKKIDLFILTHSDLDHFGGALDLVQKYPIKTIMLTGVSNKGTQYQALINGLKKQGTSFIYPHSGRDWKIGQSVYLDMLFPFEGHSLLGKQARNKNDTSISFMLRDHQYKPLMLLTGDAEEDQEWDILLSGQNLYSPLFKLGHHGSKTASTSQFLDAIHPEEVIISAGKDNKFGHPHPETLERLAKIVTVRQTMEEGVIKYEWE